MAERASIAQTSQIGLESTLGTAVAANKKLSSLLFTRGVKSNVNTFRGSGFKYPAVAAIGKEWVELGASGPMTYSEIVYPLASVLTTPTVAQISTSGAYTWAFAPSSSAPDTPKSFTIENGSSIRADKSAGCLFDQFGFTFDRENFNFTGHLIGQLLTDGATLTSSPTALDIIPMLPSTIDVFLDATSDDLGTTQLSRVLSGGCALGNRFLPLWTVDSRQTSWAAVVEGEPTATMNLMMESNSEGMGLLSQLRDSDTAFLRIAATSGQVAGTSGSNHYSFEWDAAVKVIGVDDFGDQAGVEAVNWQLQIVSDPTWGHPFTATVVNSQSAL